MSEHEPINILKALSDDAPSIIVSLDEEINKLSDQLIELMKVKEEYMIHDLLRKKMNPDFHWMPKSNL